jgi:hypothetical protein
VLVGVVAVELVVVVVVVGGGVVVVLVVEVVLLVVDEVVERVEVVVFAFGLLQPFVARLPTVDAH